MTIQRLLTNYAKAIEIIKAQGFIEPILFKGFRAREEHNFNIFFKDIYSSKTEPRPQAHRMLAISDELIKLLQCQIIISTPERMRKYYFNQLDDTNSVKLTDEPPVQELTRVFGVNWAFNPVPKLATHPDDLKYRLFAKPAANPPQKSSNELDDEEKIQKILKYLELNPEIFKDIKEHPERLEQVKKRLSADRPTPQIVGSPHRNN